MLLPAFFATGSFLRTFSANLCALLAFPATNFSRLFVAVCPCACLLVVPPVIFQRLTDSGWTCVFPLNIRIETGPFNVKTKELLQNIRQYINGCHGSIKRLVCDA